MRQQLPNPLVVAIPVGPPETCAASRTEADEVITLYEPEDFGAVGLYNEDFAPTHDSEIQRLLPTAVRRLAEAAVTTFSETAFSSSAGAALRCVNGG